MRWAGFVIGLLAWASAAQAATVVRGPYLQMVTPDSAVIVWRTDVSTQGTVKLGAAPGALSRVVNDNRSATQHEVRVTGLTPETTYAYSVGTPTAKLAGDDANHVFRTAPPPDTARPVVAWFLGDSGAGNSAQRNVRDAFRREMAGRVPDLVLHLGDVAYNTGTETEFQSRFFDVYAAELRRAAIFPTLGNHEGVNSKSSTLSGPYYDAFVLPKQGEAGGVPSGTEAYYSFDFGSLHVIVLNSQDVSRSTTGAMASWLRQDLAATNRPWIVATFHHPPYSKGTHDSYATSEGTNMIQMRENILPILEAGGADLVLAGHSHIYERSGLLAGAYTSAPTDTSKLIDATLGDPTTGDPYRKAVAPAGRGSVYITAGHGGASLGRKTTIPLNVRSEVSYGSCVLSVDKGSLTVINVRADGVISDRFTMMKGTSVHVVSPDGGESLAGGSTADVRWASGGTVAPLKLELSADSGRTWSLVADALPDTGRYAWRVPRTSGSGYRVRLTGPRGTPSDESDRDFSITAGTARTYDAIPLGDRWRYRDAATAPPANWNAAALDDSAWTQGAAQLGYGDGDEVTAIQGGPTSSRTPSAYFRKTITLEARPTAAKLKVLHDDGVAVFVNGTEVFRKRITGLAHADFASSQSADNEVDETDLTAAALAAFVPGPNVVAAVVKQAGATSSDLSFDLSLNVTLPAPVNRAPTLTAPPSVSAQQGVALTFAVQASDPDGDPLTLTAPALPQGASFDGSTLTLSWPDPRAGTYPASFRATDGDLVTEASTSIVVEPPPPPEPEEDAGVSPMPDAGTEPVDAGPTEGPDAGLEPIDAGETKADGGYIGGPPTPEVPRTPAANEGCRCDAGSTGAAALLALAGLRRRRRANPS